MRFIKHREQGWQTQATTFSHTVNFQLSIYKNRENGMRTTTVYKPHQTLSVTQIWTEKIEESFVFCLKPSVLSEFGKGGVASKTKKETLNFR